MDGDERGWLGAGFEVEKLIGADEMILELAVAARCDYIITYNRRDFRGVEQFGIEVLGPRTFLEQLGVL